MSSLQSTGFCCRLGLPASTSTGTEDNFRPGGVVDSTSREETVVNPQQVDLIRR